MPDADPLPATLDSVLRKYGKIWIWSILSAAVAALTARNVGMVGTIQWSFSTAGPGYAAPSYLFLSLGVLIPSAATLASVWFLFLFLRHHILPILFAPTPSREPGVYNDNDLAEPPDGARMLVHAFTFVLIAMASELAIAFLSIVYRVVA